MWFPSEWVAVKTPIVIGEATHCVERPVLQFVSTDVAAARNFASLQSI
jgi:hypothetical protein